MSRYAAKLLFQYRFPNEPQNCYRTVEEKLVGVEADSAKSAHDFFRKRGSMDTRQFTNDDGLVIKFEFIGIVEMIHLGEEADEDEWWYSVRRMKAPMERRNRLIPDASELSAFRHESGNGG